MKRFITKAKTLTSAYHTNKYIRQSLSLYVVKRKAIVLERYASLSFFSRYMKFQHNSFTSLLLLELYFGQNKTSDTPTNALTDGDHCHILPTPLSVSEGSAKLGGGQGWWIKRDWTFGSITTQTNEHVLPNLRLDLTLKGICYIRKQTRDLLFASVCNEKMAEKHDDVVLS